MNAGCIASCAALFGREPAHAPQFSYTVSARSPSAAKWLATRGTRRSTATDGQIALFKSVRMAIAEIAVAALIFRASKTRLETSHVSRRLRFDGFPPYHSRGQEPATCEQERRMMTRNWTMTKATTKVPAAMLAMFVSGLAAGSAIQRVDAQSTARVFELRTYTAPEGKLDALKARFRDHTMALFNKHGITSIGYFTPQDAPNSQNTLVYIIAYPSREAAKTNWAAFQADPDWQAAYKASSVNGPLQTKVESVFLEPTEFSPLK
jgi:hypothetical protein